MNRHLRELKSHFGAAHSLYNLLLINILVFLVLKLSHTFLYLFNVNTFFLDRFISWVSLPSNLSKVILQPWSFLSYMFVHEEVMHILFNMLILFWTGKLFAEYLGNDKLWATYILGGLTGGILYVIAFNLFPAFAMAGEVSRLIGASAGVIAILVAVATLLPDYTVFLIIFGPVKLKYIALISILLYAISIPNGNAGGNIAHLGGALFGFIMIKQLKKGNDLTAWLVNLIYRLKGKKRGKMKVVSGRSRATKDDEFFTRQANTQESIDRILDKINRSGFDSLTKDEKEQLYKASGKK